MELKLSLIVGLVLVLCLISIATIHAYNPVVKRIERSYQDRFSLPHSSLGWVDSDSTDPESLPMTMVQLLTSHDAVVYCKASIFQNLEPERFLSANRGGMITFWYRRDLNYVPTDFLMVSKTSWGLRFLSMLNSYGSEWKSRIFPHVNNIATKLVSKWPRRKIIVDDPVFTVFTTTDDIFPQYEHYRYDLVRWTPTRQDSNNGFFPKLIVQTWTEVHTNVKYIEQCQMRIQELNSDYEYVLFTDYDMRRFIDSHYSEEYGQAYESIIPGAYRSDFFRLLFLYKYGGFYADISLDFKISFDKMTSLFHRGTNFIVPIDNQSSHLCLFNAFMVVGPMHPIIESNIQIIMGHVQGGILPNEAKSPEPCLYLTGPCSLGEAFLRIYHRSPTIIPEENAYSGATLLKHIHALQSIQTMDGKIEIAATRHRSLNAMVSYQMREEVGKPHYSEYCKNNDVWLTSDPASMFRSNG